MSKIWENDKVICSQKGDIQYLQFKKLLQYPEVLHCYTLRSGEKLNFPPIYKDEETLRKSYEKICNCLNLDADKVVKPYQTHTDKVKNITANDVENIFNTTDKVNIENESYVSNTNFEKESYLDNVDGIITNQKGITLITTSADCISLLFYDNTKKVIGSVHSGWRGTLKGICKNAVLKMEQEYYCKPEDIICLICPSIRMCCFEVDEDVKDLFYEKYKNIPEINNIIQIKPNEIESKNTRMKNADKEKTERLEEHKTKYVIDTVAINKYLLAQMGLKEGNIVDSEICTVCHSKDFHSYRKDKENSGRNAALISLKI